MDELMAAMAEVRLQMTAWSSAATWVWRRHTVEADTYQPSRGTIESAMKLDLMPHLITISRSITQSAYNSNSHIVIWYIPLNRLSLSGNIFDLDTDKGWEAFEKWMTP